MDRSADFVQLLSQFVQQIEGEWTPDLKHGPTRLFESDPRRLRKKDLLGPLEEVEIYLRSEGVDRTAARKTCAV